MRSARSIRYLNHIIVSEIENSNNVNTPFVHNLPAFHRHFGKLTDITSDELQLWRQLELRDVTFKLVTRGKKHPVWSMVTLRPSREKELIPRKEFLELVAKRKEEYLKNWEKRFTTLTKQEPRFTKDFTTIKEFAEAVGASPKKRKKPSGVQVCSYPEGRKDDKKIIKQKKVPVIPRIPNSTQVNNFVEQSEIFFLKKEFLYTKLKYSRCPASDAVSGGFAALLAGFVGFLISEKFGIELVDSGDFYVALMYAIFVGFTCHLLTRLSDGGKKHSLPASFGHNITFVRESFLFIAKRLSR